MWNWLKILFNMLFGRSPRRLPQSGSPYRDGAECAATVEEPAKIEPPKPTRQDVEAKAKATGLTVIEVAIATDALHVLKNSQEAGEAMQIARYLPDDRAYSYLSRLHDDLYYQELRALPEFTQALVSLETCRGHKRLRRELESVIQLCTNLESAKRLRGIVAHFNWDANECEEREKREMLLSVDRLLVKLA